MPAGLVTPHAYFATHSSVDKPESTPSQFTPTRIGGRLYSGLMCVRLWSVKIPQSSASRHTRARAQMCADVCIKSLRRCEDTASHVMLIDSRVVAFRAVCFNRTPFTQMVGCGFSSTLSKRSRFGRSHAMQRKPRHSNKTACNIIRCNGKWIAICNNLHATLYR